MELERDGKRLVVMTLRVPRETPGELTALARRLGLTRSELVRRGIWWVQRHPEEVVQVGEAAGGGGAG